VPSLALNLASATHSTSERLAAILQSSNQLRRKGLGDGPQSRSGHRRAIVVFAALVLFAFVLLAAILAPAAVKVEVALPALVMLLRVALRALR
jgi:hypothetical protein